ncbi:MAG TPA: SDR family NAD(P)-dependent oxidoreductase [Anaerolineaceae bacterium]|nr:SDR family NAD(P)-dependent oxidoreductase [Anaerolineaceae bacterium]
MFDFHDQVVIVTGGTGNLGRAVVHAFHAAGAHLVAPYKSAGQSEKPLAELAGSRDHMLLEGIDVTDPQQMDRLVQETRSRFGRIDVLINTVGGYRAGAPLHETTLETWDFLFNLNARSVFVACRAVIPTMLEQCKGKIVNIATHSALAAQGKDGAYSASKSAILRLTESMAAEYKLSGIQVNAVLPSALVSAEEVEADPTRGVTPDSVAQVILALCSDACQIIQGAIIPAYGGRF